jgi:hypothetical protein
MTDIELAGSKPLVPDQVLTEEDIERLKREFYRDAPTQAERVAREVAEHIDGLDHEIAVLRAMLREFVNGAEPNYTLMLRSMELLAKLLSVRYRISKKSQHDLMSSMAAMLQSVRAELGIGEDSGA